MGTTATILLLWAAFAASHMGLSSDRLRPRLVARLGARGFTGLYALLALAIFIPLVSTYFDGKHTGPLLWSLGGVPGVKWLMSAGMGLAFALAVSGLVRPSPASLAPGKAEVIGVYRITRHPLLMGMGLYGLFHLLVVPVNASELVFFGGFPIFVLAGCRHQDERKLGAIGDDYQRFYDETPFLPGSRRGFLRGVSEQPIPMAIGLGVAAVLRHFHANLFG